MIRLIAKLEKPKMIEASANIDLKIVDDIDAWIDENVGPWMIHRDVLENTARLQGYFESNEEAQSAYGQLLATFSLLPECATMNPVEDKDWKEAYKEHFKAWEYEGLHWVPTWEKNEYDLPEGEKAIYLDPGMAFGTGNHETTRLCAMRLMEMSKAFDGKVSTIRVMDCGCGSGILSISAAALGFGQIEGFDIDVDSIEISEENLEQNGLSGKAKFEVADLVKGIGNKQADLVLANILANVLMDHASWLIGAVAIDGRLILSGILAKEVDEVRRTFFAIADKAWEAFDVDCRIDGEWADLVFIRE